MIWNMIKYIMAYNSHGMLWSGAPFMNVNLMICGLPEGTWRVNYYSVLEG